MADAALVLSLEPEVAAQMTVEAQGVFEPRADIVGNYLREIYASDELEPINEVGSRRHMQELRIALKEIDLKASRGELMPRKFAVDIAKGDLIALIAAVNQLLVLLAWCGHGRARQNRSGNKPSSAQVRRPMREPEITIKFQCTLYGARRMAIKKRPRQGGAALCR